MKPIQTKQNYQNHYQPARGTTYHLFPTPFFHGQLNLNLNEVKADMDRLIDKVKAKEGDNELNNYTTYFDQDVRQEALGYPGSIPLSINSKTPILILSVINLITKSMSYQDMTFISFHGLIDMELNILMQCMTMSTH